MLRYYKYFLGKLHRNFVGTDTNKNIYILSILEVHQKKQCVSSLKSVLISYPSFFRRQVTSLGYFDRPSVRAK